MRLLVNVISVAALVVATTFSASSAAQDSRRSLGERVAALESKVQGQAADQSNITILNRLDALQAEVQALRGLVEQQAFEIENQKRMSADQYTDLHSRITRLENSRASGAANTPTPIVELPAQAEDIVLQPGAEPLTAQQPVFESDPQSPQSGGPELSPARPADPDLPTTQIPAPNPINEKAAYDKGFDAIKAGRYAESARLFSAFLKQYPNGEYTDNAAYWLGESYYVTQNYQIALETFQRLLRNSPNGPKSADAALKIGYCYYELREWDKAEQALTKVVQQYPDTTVARLAQGRLRALRLEAQGRRS